MSQPVTYSSSKSVKSIYTVNRPLLIVSIAVIAILTVAGYFWYQYRFDQTSEALLSRAEQLEKDGEWNKATSYYQRYLIVEPDNTEVLVKLVKAFAQGEPNPNRLRQLNGLLYRVLGRAPDRDELRQMLAENLIKVGALEEAEEEAQKLTGKDPDTARAARKVIAISKFFRAPVDRTIVLSDAVQGLLDSAEELPNDFELISVTANALRSHPSELPPGKGDPISLADEMMDRLVANDPGSVKSRMARYKYRVRYSLPGAVEDLQATLKLEPDHVEALFLSALQKISANSPEKVVTEADRELRRVIELSPSDFRPYLVLAELLQKQGNIKDAEAILNGAKAATNNSFELGLALGELQIQSKQLDKAVKTLEQLRSDSTSYLVRFERESRTKYENQLRLFAARLNLAQDQPADAVSELRTIYLTQTDAVVGKASAEWIQAVQLLAGYHGQRGEWDQAAQYWDSLLRVLPDQPVVVEGAVNAAMSTGNVEAALEHIDEFNKVAKPTSNLMVQVVQAHLVSQLQRQSTERNWTEFQEALKSAKKVAGDRPELLIAEIEYLGAVGGDKKTISSLLHEGEQRFRPNPKFWHNAAVWYQKLGARQDQQRALDEYRKLANSTIEPALLESLLLVNDERFAEAEDLLSKTANEVQPSEQVDVQRRRLEIVVREGDVKRAFQLAQELVADYPEDPKLLLTAAEIALAAGQTESARDLEAKLGRTANHSDAQYLRIRRLMQDYDGLSTSDREDLKQTIAGLRAERPRWYPVVALAARYAELQGNRRDSIGDYQLAIELGDRRSFTVQQLVTLLYQSNRIGEAEGYLALLSTDSSATSFVDAMSLELAVKGDKTDEALNLARQSMERLPHDASRRIYLANLLKRSGKPEEAEALLRKSVQDLPSDSRVWTALVSYLAQNNKVDEAREILETIANDDSIHLNERQSVAAQGYEAIGDYQAATDQYQLALKKNASNSQIRMKFAQMLARVSPRAAQQEYDRVLEIDPSNVVAQRELAVLLSSTGLPEDWTRANQLLEALKGKGAGDSKTSDRLRAMLLSQQGRSRADRIANCRSARKILEKQISSAKGESTDLVRLLLVQLLEREALLSGDQSLIYAAQQEFRESLDTGSPSVERLSLYVEFLIRHARKNRDKVTEQAVNSADGQPVESLHEKFLSDAEDQLVDLRRLQMDNVSQLDTLSVAFASQIAQARGNVAEAKAVIDEFVANEGLDALRPNSLQEFVAVGRLYASAEDHASAEKWYRRVMEANRNAYILVVQALVDQNKRLEAAQLCLDLSPDKLSPEVAIVLENVMTLSEGSPPFVFDRAEKALRAVLDANPDNVSLLQAEAIRRASRGEYDGAIAAFTRMVQLEPENILALNNLSTMLAEIPNRRPESLELIQRAIQVAGRQAGLLDTQGTIYLKMGNSEQAIASLEEATAGGVADARYYLHLAAAYHLAERDTDALRTLNDAQAFELDKFLLTKDDRELLETLNKVLVSKASLTGAQL